MNENNLKELLKGHVEWIHWRTSDQSVGRRGKQLILSQDIVQEMTLDEQNLASAEFHDIILTDVSLAKANLTGAFFMNCDLTNVDFNSSNLSKAVFHQCKFSNVRFEGARCYKCEFDESPMADVGFRNSNLQYAQISNLILQNVDFSYSDCHRMFVYSCKFIHCIGKGLKNINTATLEKTCFEGDKRQFELMSRGKDANLSGAGNVLTHSVVA